MLELALVGPTEYEITLKGVSKGAALKVLCRRLGVSEGRAVAFGDSGNDATFAQSSCTFVAMGNATPEIKAAADDVCPSVSEDGVGVWPSCWGICARAWLGSVVAVIERAITRRRAWL